MATLEVTKEITLLRYNRVLPTTFNEIVLSEEIGQSIAANKIVRWNSSNLPIAFPTTVQAGDKLRITNSTISSNGIFTITGITTTGVLNDTVIVTPDNFIDVIGSGSRPSGVGNFVIYHESSTALGSVSRPFRELYVDSFIVGAITFSGPITIPDGSEMESDAAPTTDAGIANKKYVDDSIATIFNPPYRVFEEITTTIVAGTSHTLPAGASYNGDAPFSASTPVFGRFLEIILNGEKLIAGNTGFERDYKETGVNAPSQTTVTFEFDLNSGDRLEYKIYNPFVLPQATTVFEEISVGQLAGTPHALPLPYTYFGDAPSSSLDAEFGAYLQIHYNGQKIYAGDTGFERDYKETGTDLTGQTYITFEFDLNIGDRLEYTILKA